MKTFGFGILSNIRYYSAFLFHKISILWECSSGRSDVLRAEIFWLAGLFRIVDPYKQSFTATYVENRFGKFYVQPTIHGLYMASPAFERLELERLVDLMKKDLENGKSVLFIDVGSYYGDYIVRVGNALKQYAPLLTMIAFEPEANNFEPESATLLRKNIKANGISNATVFKQGLGDSNTIKPNAFGIKVKKLDSILSKKTAETYDSVYMKIDIEGGETAALKGSQQFIHSSKKFTLLVEDFIDSELVPYLSNRFRFFEKLSPQNSFWTKP